MVSANSSTEQFVTIVGRFGNAVRVDHEKVVLLQLDRRAFVFGLGKHSYRKTRQVESVNSSGAAPNERRNVAGVDVFKGARLLEHAIEYGRIAVAAAALAEIPVHA